MIELRCLQTPGDAADLRIRCICVLMNVETYSELGISLEQACVTCMLCQKQISPQLSEFICPAIIHVWECTGASPCLLRRVKYYFAEVEDK